MDMGSNVRTGARQHGQRAENDALVTGVDCSGGGGGRSADVEGLDQAPQVATGGAEMRVEAVRGDDSKAPVMWTSSTRSGMDTSYARRFLGKLPRRASATAVTRNAHRWAHR